MSHHMFSIFDVCIQVFIMATQRKSGKESGDVANTSFVGSVSKALQPGADWSDKDHLLDVVYWGKQILALGIGIVFGVLPMSGIFAIAAYVAISTGIAQQFVIKYHKVDEDDVGGFWELAKEGFGAAFATFMVSWITVYSALHG